MRTRDELRRELRAISSTSTAGLVEEPKQRTAVPSNAYAISHDGDWALLVARYRATCKRCGKQLGKKQRVAWSLETRETCCTACVQEVAFSLTSYGRRRKQGYRAHARDRKQRAAEGTRYREAMKRERERERERERKREQSRVP